MLLFLGISGYAQIKLPALSPKVEISQKIGLTTAILSYSRPSLRGRELFGDDGILVFGEKWRTGANATTKIEFSNDIVMNGQSLPKGTYALLSTPQKTSWTFHFYPYQPLSYTNFLVKQPMFEIKVPIQRLDYAMETLSLHFEAIDLSGANLVLQWANYKVEVPITLAEHNAILAHIDTVLKGPSDFDYFQAALYLHETQTDLPLALSYIRKVTKSDNALFFQVYREALILKDLNRNQEAVTAAKRSKKLSQNAGNNDLVRLSQRIIDNLSD